MFSVTIRERSGQVYTFHFDKPEILIGRIKGNDVILPKQNISKRHALIRAEGPTFVVEDLGSTNGTFVNGHRIAVPVEIGPDDKVYLGDFVMQFYPIDVEIDRDAPPDLGADAHLDPPAGGSGDGYEIPLGPAMRDDSQAFIRTTSSDQGRETVVSPGFAELQAALGEFNPDLEADEPDILSSARDAEPAVDAFAALDQLDQLSGGADRRPSGSADSGGSRGAGSALAGLPIRRPPPMSDATHGSADDDDFIDSDLDPFAGMSQADLGIDAAEVQLQRRSSGVDFVEHDASSGSSVVFDARNEATVAQLHDQASEARAALDAVVAAAEGQRRLSSKSPAAPAAAARAPSGAAEPASAAEPPVAPVEPVTQVAPGAKAARNAPVPAPAPQTAVGLDEELSGALAAELDALSADDAPMPSRRAGIAPTLGFGDPDHAPTRVASPAQIAEVIRAARRAQTGGVPLPADAFAPAAGSEGSARKSGASPPISLPTGTPSSASLRESAAVAAINAIGAMPTRNDATGSVHATHHDDLAMLYGRAMVELRAMLGVDATTMSDEVWAALERAVGDLILRASRAGELSPGHSAERLRRDLVYELTWLGPLESLLDDPSIERIEVDAFDRVSVVRSGHRSLAAARFSSQPALQAAVGRLVHAIGVAIEPGTHQVVGALADGTTAQLVWPPLAPAGPLLVLTKPRSEAPSLAALCGAGWLDSELADALVAALSDGRSVVVVGAVGPVRRAIIEALAAALPKDERVALIEHDGPVALGRAHLIRLAPEGNRLQGAWQLSARLGVDRVVCSGADRALLQALVEVGCEGAPRFLASWTGWDAADAVRRAAHAVMLAHPGLDKLIAFERVAMALDLIIEVQAPPPPDDPEATTAPVPLIAVHEVAGAGPDGIDLSRFGG